MGSTKSGTGRALIQHTDSCPVEDRSGGCEIGSERDDRTGRPRELHIGIERKRDPIELYRSGAGIPGKIRHNSSHCIESGHEIVDDL